MDSERKVLAFEEVTKHKERDNIWLLISGKVYDVTQFMEEHPGGDEVLLAATGRDATDDFEDVGHSDDAKELMQKYYIAEIDPSTIPLKKSSQLRPPPPVPHQAEDSGFLVKILQFFVPLLILGLAFAVQFLGKRENKEN
ncbi:hypothetical protein SLEP1_g2213 [Rubroshorea leprosula]|uniref:Cytochrome b5 heme-binding domain-containing protein n=1 Tax=Rubroshorea leprosula TaxID=152421 RepID=A0AAV5HQ51_9ROSI|nr:hypothetical protein SLEP1_g2213 [Rubroshorea leprosula]